MLVVDRYPVLEPTFGLRARVRWKPDPVQVGADRELGAIVGRPAAGFAARRRLDDRRGIGDAGQLHGPWAEDTLGEARLLKILAVHPAANLGGIRSRAELGDADVDLVRIQPDPPIEHLAGRALQVAALELLHGGARMSDIGEGDALADEVDRIAPVEPTLQSVARH